MTELERRAKEFATECHTGQVRKYTNEEYIAHPAEVVELVRGVHHTEEMLAAAWLHDVVEDCDVTLREVYEKFGVKVMNLVGWLTDVSKPTDGNRAERKALDRDHIAAGSAQAKTIKLADLISNTKSIVERDPKFAAVYLPEKQELLAVLRDGDPTLWEEAQRLAVEGLKRLEKKKAMA